MSVLPKIALPTSKFTLPDSGEVVGLRPMTGQEFEILLVAKESKEVLDQIDAIYQMLDAVTVLPEDFDSKQLSPMDFDFLFTKLIITSYGKKTIDSAYRCRTPGKEGKPCDNVISVTVDLENDVDFELGDFELKTEFDLMQYKLVIDKPNTAHILNTQKDVFDSVKSHINKLIDTTTGQEWKFKGKTPDVPSSEADSFVRNSVPSTVIQDIASNIKSYPRMSYTGTVKCKKCGTVHNVRLNGFLDFFGFASPNTK